MTCETTTTIHMLDMPDDVSVAQLATGRVSVAVDEDVNIVGPANVLLPMFEQIVTELRAITP